MAPDFPDAFNDIEVARALRVSLANHRARMAALLADLVLAQIEVIHAAAVRAHMRGSAGLRSFHFTVHGRQSDP